MRKKNPLTKSSLILVRRHKQDGKSFISNGTISAIRHKRIAFMIFHSYFLQTLVKEYSLYLA